MEQISGIYAITHVPSGRAYIGSSKDVIARWAGHQKRLNARTHHSSKLQGAWTKYGADAFHFIIIEQCIALDRTVREQFWIDQTQASKKGYGFNMSSSSYGSSHPDISAKIAASLTGQKLSEERKAKISAAHKGMVRGPHSEEHKLNLRAAHLGKKHSEESRQKIYSTHWARDPVRRAEVIAKQIATKAAWTPERRQAFISKIGHTLFTRKAVL
jgi:group I intron endonuclease